MNTDRLIGFIVGALVMMVFNYYSRRKLVELTTFYYEQHNVSMRAMLGMRKYVLEKWDTDIIKELEREARVSKRTEEV